MQLRRVPLTEQRKPVFNILTNLLANQCVLHAKTRNYRWNVVGAEHHDLHKIYEEQCGEINHVTDEVAQQIRSLGGFAAGGLNEILDHAELKVCNGQVTTAQKSVADLLTDHDLIIQFLKGPVRKCAENQQDRETKDLVTGWLARHEEMASTLRSILSGRLHLQDVS